MGNLKQMTPAQYAVYIWENCESRCVFQFYDGHPAKTCPRKLYTVTATYIGSLCIAVNKFGGGNLFTFEVADSFYQPELAANAKEQFIAAFSEYLMPIGDQLWVEVEPAEAVKPIPHEPEEVSVKTFAEDLNRMTYSDKRKMIYFTRGKDADELFFVVFREVSGALCCFCNARHGGKLFAHDMTVDLLAQDFELPFLEYLANQGFGDSVWIKR